MYRPEALVYVSFPYQHSEGPYYTGLICFLHGEVGIVPPSENAQPLELLPLNVHEPGRVFPAPLPYLHPGEGRPFAARFRHNLVFYRHSVTIPAGNERRVVPHHGMALHDEILQYLVESGSQMDVAVGVWRAIMEDEGV